MASTEKPPFKTVSTPIRAFLIVASVLLFLAGVQVFVLSDQTDRFFAWTINPPLTAAYLGAGYWAALPATLVALRESAWSRIRVSLPTTLIVVPLLTLTTFLHLDRFHFTAPDLLPRIAAWVWLAVYVLIPPAVIVAVIRQIRLPGEDAPRSEAMSPLLRVLLIMLGIISAVASVGLYLAPAVTAPLWPWMLSPLTARVIASWLLGNALVALYMVWQDDVEWNALGGVGMAGFGLLQLIAVARYPAFLGESGPRGWLYVAYMVSTMLIGAWAILAARGSRSKAAA